MQFTVMIGDVVFTREDVQRELELTNEPMEQLTDSDLAMLATRLESYFHANMWDFAAEIVADLLEDKS